MYILITLYEIIIINNYKMYKLIVYLHYYLIKNLLNKFYHFINYNHYYINILFLIYDERTYYYDNYVWTIYHW